MREKSQNGTGPGKRPLASLALIVVAVVVGGYLAYRWLGSVELSLPLGEFEALIRSWGSWGVLASLGLMIVHCFVPFPSEFLAIANGIVFGPVWGVVITWSGAMIGAALAFWLTRLLGEKFVRHVVARRHWRTLDAWVARNGAGALFAGRFIPVISFNLINIAAGLTRIRWWTFLWSTGLGILPMTILMVMMGDQIIAGGKWIWAALPVVAILLWLTIRHVRDGSSPG